MTHGSPGWQTIFVSFALVLILFEVVRGWRLGVVRQMVRLFALCLAYATAIFGGKALLPLLRPFLHVPDFIISIFAGALLALLVYATINALGAILFKRTGQQPAGIVRLLYGMAGGALGVFFGLFTIWLVVVAIRSVGAIATAQMQAQSAAQHRVATLAARPSPSPLAEDSQSLVQSLARLKNSIEQGPLGDTVKAVDVVPAQTYQTLGKVGTVAANPQTAERFLSYPGAKELTENPKIVALRDDPAIVALIQQQRFLELLQNPKLIEAVNDPALAAQVRSFDFQKALDYALRKN
jgi:membrane protein required for colicin V production